MEIKEELLSLENKLVDKKFRKDLAFLRETLADNFLEIGSSGIIYNKTETLAILKEDNNTTTIIEKFNIQHLCDFLYLVIYKTTTTCQFGIKSYSKRSSIWKKTGNKWQILFHQGTIIKQ
ncbi:MAG: DUF4440 domain-containing protein [bacterium]